MIEIVQLARPGWDMTSDVAGQVGDQIRSSRRGMIEGDLPKRAKKLVLEWATLNRSELREMWTSQEFRKLSPLE